MISKYINNNKKIINDLKNDIKLDNLFLNEYNNYINLGKKNDLINKLNLNINLQQGGADSEFNKERLRRCKCIIDSKFDDFNFRELSEQPVGLPKSNQS
jgi:hypothetical protein